MPTESKYGEQLNIRVQTEMKERFKQAARRMEMSQTDALRCAIAAFCAQAEATEPVGHGGRAERGGRAGPGR